MLTLSRRDCKLGSKQSSDTKEAEGAAEPLRMLTFEIEEMMLDKNELNALLSEPHAHGVLYDTGARPVEPYLKCFKALEFEAVTKGAYVELAFGLDTEIKFTECTLSKIKLSLRVGGLTALSCKVTTASVLDDTLPLLFEQFGKAIECELRAEPPGAQQDLPLNKFEGDDAPKPPKSKPVRRSTKRNGNGRPHARH